MTHYLLHTRPKIGNLPIEYTYLYVGDGSWYFSLTTEKYECAPNPDGLIEAVEAWKSVDFKYAGMGFMEFIRALGVKI